MRILFFHNTIAEYRLPFFVELAKNATLNICLTDSELSKKIYNTDSIDKNYENIQIFTVPKKIRIKKWINYIIQSGKYDYVVLPTLDTVRDAFIARLICKCAKKKKIITAYFWEKWVPQKIKQPRKKRIKNSFQAIVAKKILKRVDVFWYPGVCTKNYFNRIGIPEERMFKIHDCSEMPEDELDLDLKWKVTNQIRPSQKIVLYFGRLIQRKGLSVLLQAFSKLEDDEYYLLIVGDGKDKKKYEEEVKKRNIKNVLFVGAVDPKNRYQFFSMCDIFVLPSIIYNGSIEAWGLTLNEAIQCGKYIISTDAVGAAYELIQEANGEMIPQNDVDALVEALKNAKDKCDLRAVKETSTELYRQYNYKTMADDIINALGKRWIDEKDSF